MRNGLVDQHGLAPPALVSYTGGYLTVTHAGREYPVAVDFDRIDRAWAIDERTSLRSGCTQEVLDAIDADAEGWQEEVARLEREDARGEYADHVMSVRSVA